MAEDIDMSVETVPANRQVAPAHNAEFSAELADVYRVLPKVTPEEIETYREIKGTCPVVISGPGRALGYIEGLPKPLGAVQRLVSLRETLKQCSVPEHSATSFAANLLHRIKRSDLEQRAMLLDQVELQDYRLKDMLRRQGHN